MHLGIFCCNPFVLCEFVLSKNVGQTPSTEKFISCFTTIFTMSYFKWRSFQFIFHEDKFMQVDNIWWLWTFETLKYDTSVTKSFSVMRCMKQWVLNLCILVEMHSHLSITQSDKWNKNGRFLCYGYFALDKMKSELIRTIFIGLATNWVTVSVALNDHLLDTIDDKCLRKMQESPSNSVLCILCFSSKSESICSPTNWMIVSLACVFTAL